MPDLDSMLLASPDSTLADLYRTCLAESRPGLFPIHHHADDRGWSLMGLFSGVLTGGQVNCSLQYPGVTKAWHRHHNQTDFWCVIDGMLKVAVMNDPARSRWLAVIGERNPAIIIIPPGLWHGAAAVGPCPATLLYYVTQTYRPDSPDEERKPHDWQWNPWPVAPR